VHSTAARQTRSAALSPVSASEMTYIVSGGAFNSTHSPQWRSRTFGRPRRWSNVPYILETRELFKALKQ